MLNKYIAPLATCFNPPLSRDKPLGAPGFVKRVYYLFLLTGGHRTRVAAVTLDNMAEGVFAQQEDLP